MTMNRALNSTPASKKITKRIEELDDWRGETLAWLRQRIHDADPEIVESGNGKSPRPRGFRSGPMTAVSVPASGPSRS